MTYPTRDCTSGHAATDAQELGYRSHGLQSSNGGRDTLVLEEDSSKC